MADVSHVYVINEIKEKFGIIFDFFNGWKIIKLIFLKSIVLYVLRKMESFFLG